MDLSDPIRSVVPCLHGPVLGALARTTVPMRLTDVHERVRDAFLAGVRKVLLALVDDGLVSRVPGGYVLNRKHVAADGVVALADLHGALVERIRSWLKRRDEPVVAVGLYGLAARRDGGSNSDVDLVIIVEKDEVDTVVDELADAVERWTGNRGHVQGLTAHAPTSTPAIEYRSMSPDRYGSRNFTIRITGEAFGDPLFAPMAIQIRRGNGSVGPWNASAELKQITPPGTRPAASARLVRCDFVRCGIWRATRIPSR